MASFPTSVAAKKARAAQIFERLQAFYPDATCTLNYRSPLELLVATILAAQCTDERVNVVTKTLFKKYRRPEDYQSVPIAELEADIRTCGFYRNKAKSIVGACTVLLRDFGGQVPGTMPELLTLNGVGRKTANVVLGQCFGGQGVIVDTHCTRVSKRLGFTRNSDPVKIEQDLMKVWPPKVWTLFSHFMVFHGRALCQARSPQCGACPLADLCPHAAAERKSKPTRKAR